MAPLKNPRHEKLAQEMAKGKSATEAMAEVGYTDPRNSTRLTKKDEIRARIDELIGKGAERAEITIERILSELAKIGFSNMMDYMVVGSDGKPSLDFSAITREQAAAIQELNVETVPGGEERPEVTRVRFKLSDKRAALVDLGKHLGAFKEKVEHSGTVTLEQLVGASLEKTGEAKGRSDPDRT
jgi:phage terminase small subunit